MGFRIFTISSMYPGNLESFYSRFPEADALSYKDHSKMLLEDTTEFAGSYFRAFRKLGVEAECVIANDKRLQNKWKKENYNRSDNRKDLLFEQVRKFQPEILSIENLSYTDTSWLKEIRIRVKSIKLIMAYHCSPIKTSIYERLKMMNFAITCTPGLKLDMEMNGIRAYLVYHGFDSGILNRIDEDRIPAEKELLFSGSLAFGAGFHNDRIEFIESLLKDNTRIDLYTNLEKRYKIRALQFLHFANRLIDKTGTNGIKKYFPLLEHGILPVRNYSSILLNKSFEPVFGMEMYQLFTKYKVVLNIHGEASGSCAGNMRLFEVSGVGSCLLTDNKSNLKTLFDINNEIVTYNSVEECKSKVRWLSDNENERRRIALAGQQRTLNYHTVEKRSLQILDIIRAELSD